MKTTRRQKPFISFRVRSVWFGLAVILALVLPSLIIASGPADQSGMTELAPGDDDSSLTAWVIGLYNHHRVWFAVLVTLVMAVLGTVISLVSERLLTMVGMAARRPRGQ